MYYVKYQESAEPGEIVQQQIAACTIARIDGAIDAYESVIASLS